MSTCTCELFCMNILKFHPDRVVLEQSRIYHHLIKKYCQTYILKLVPSWSWSYGCWIYNYLCNQCLSPLTLCVRILLRRCVLDTTLCDKVCQWLATGWRFSPGTPASSTNKTDRHDITEILLKMALSTIFSIEFLRKNYIVHRNIS